MRGATPVVPRAPPAASAAARRARRARPGDLARLRRPRGGQRRSTSFIWDWYWYDGAPAMHEALEDGFLRARNRERVRFAVMWTNHPWMVLFPTARPRGRPRLSAGAGGAGRRLDDPPQPRLRRLAVPPPTGLLAPRRQPVLVVWDGTRRARRELGADGLRRLLADLRALARSLGHEGFHCPPRLHPRGRLRARPRRRPRRRPPRARLRQRRPLRADRVGRHAPARRGGDAPLRRRRRRRARPVGRARGRRRSPRLPGGRPRLGRRRRAPSGPARRTTARQALVVVDETPARSSASSRKAAD